LLLAGVTLALIGPVGLLTLPLTALLLASGVRSQREIITASAVGAMSLWWLLQPGDPQDQLVRTAAILGTAAFATLALSTRLSLTNRSLVAVSAAAAGVGLLLLVPGISWHEIRWWAGYNVGFAARTAISWMWIRNPAGPAGTISADAAAQLEEVTEGFVVWMADLFPAFLALFTLAGFAFAAAAYRHICPAPKGQAPGRFRDFRFSEHLGWAAAAPLAVILLTEWTGAKRLAANILVVAGALYAVRGTAVLVFRLLLLRLSGAVTWGMATVLAVFVIFWLEFTLPAILTAAIVVGLLDSGMDLRRRWVPPPVGS
jgi:hypothetical protein